MRRPLTIASLSLSALMLAAPAAALRAQIGDPFNRRSTVGDRMLWIREEPRSDGLLEESRLRILPKPGGAPGALLGDVVILTPGLPLLPENCGRLPFTSELALDCGGTISDSRIDLGRGDDEVDYGLAVPAAIEGGEGDDVLRGGSGDDHLGGGDGNDTLQGRSGTDWLEGGPGADVLEGGAGADQLRSNDDEGGDVVRGGDARDFLTGDGGDQLRGGGGDDRFEVIWEGGGGAVQVYGDDGDDEVFVFASVAARLFGGTGNDSLNAGDGNDTLDGGGGNDTLDGGSGGDTFSGGPGTDVVVYTHRPFGIRVALDGIANDGYPGEADAVAEDIENVRGGSGNDRISGNALGNLLSGGAGDDLLTGAAGGDTLLGGEGRDTAHGGPGDDVLNGHAGNDVLNGGAGADSLYGGDGDDLIDALDGTADRVSCGAGTDEARVDAIDVVASGCERVVRAK